MASIWKRKTDRKDATKPWKITYMTPTGKPKTVIGLLDKRESERLGAKLEEQSDRRRRGLDDDRAEKMAAQGKRLLAEHLSEYESHLQGKGNTKRHIRSE